MITRKKKNAQGGRQPLAGIKVLELARILAGPWAGQALADLGADVIKVESPAGDDTREWGPPYVARADGSLEAAYFHAANRGKRSIIADFKNKEHMVRLRHLIGEADVIVENFKFGGLKKFGLDYESVKALNPGVIYCSITGFGQTGPYRNRAGYDFMIQGMAGVMDVTGDPDGEPQKVGVAVADIFTGLYAVIAIEAALIERARTGLGAHIDMALFDCMTAVLANQAMNALVSGTSPKRLGNAHPNIVPYQVFAVADGHVIIAVGNDRQFAALCDLIGLPALITDPRFATNPSRVDHRDTLIDILAPVIRLWTKADLLASLEEKSIPGGPINTVGEVMADPQIAARAMRIKVNDHTEHDDPDSPRDHTIPYLRLPLMIDGKPLVSDRPAPRLGEHDHETHFARKAKS